MAILGKKNPSCLAMVSGLAEMTVQLEQSIVEPLSTHIHYQSQSTPGHHSRAWLLHFSGPMEVEMAVKVPWTAKKPVPLKSSSLENMLIHSEKQLLSTERQKYRVNQSERKYRTFMGKLVVAESQNKKEENKDASTAARLLEKLSVEG